MERKLYLDWLRVILFSVLVIWHAAIGFSPYYAELIYGVGNDVRSGAFTEWALNFSHSFRLHVVFLISGAGTFFAFQGRGFWQFLRDRCLRLIIPLVVAILSVNLVRAYLVADQIDPGVEFYGFAANWITSISYKSTQHLWFVANIVCYTAVLSPVFYCIAKNEEWPVRNAVKKILLAPYNISIFVFIPVTLVILVVLTKPYFRSLGGEGHLFLVYMGFYLFGFLTMAFRDRVPGILERTRLPLILLGVIFGMTLVAITSYATKIDPRYGALIQFGGWAKLGLGVYNPVSLSASVLNAVVPWFMSLGIVGYAVRYLNTPSKHLRLLNEAVYPVYIWHYLFCTIGIIVAAKLRLPWVLEFLGVVVFTFSASFLCFLVLRRTKVTRLLFGIRQPTPVKKPLPA